MSDEYIEVNTLKELKDRIGSYEKFKWQEFRFEKATKGMSKEYHIFYKDNRVETFSMDIIPTEELENKIKKIREVDPKSIDEWLNKDS